MFLQIFSSCHGNSLISYYIWAGLTFFNNKKPHPMKKLSLLIVILAALTAIPATAQKHFRDTKRNNTIHATPFKPSPADEAGRLPMNEMYPSLWIQDSTYYSSWNLSSTSWDLYEKNFRTFNSDGQLHASTYIDYDAGLLLWHNSFRYLYFYYPSGGYEVTGTQTWDNSLSSWKDVSHYHYNTSGSTDTSFSKVYDASHHRYNSGWQRICTYNGSGLNTVTLVQKLDTVVSAWVNQTLYSYTFDANNHMTQCIQQTWNTGLSSWVNDMKSDYVYDANGFEISAMDYTWNSGGSSWDNFMRRTFINNAAGSPLSVIAERWNFGTTSWENSARESWQYDANNQVTQYLDEDWDDVLLGWVNYSKETYSYYSNGTVDEYTGFLWNPLLLSFMDYSYNKSDSSGYTLEYYSKTIDETSYVYTDGYKYIYTYTPFHNTDNILEKQLDPVSLAWYDFSHRLDTYDANQNLTTEIDQNYDTLAMTWTNTYKQEHFYTYSTGIHELGRTSDYCFYANPIEAGKSIVCPNLDAGRNYIVSLNDIQGRLVCTKNIISGESITVPATLAPGMYMLQIISEGKTLACGKMIVR
jgi:hypothetical protein